ncbi:SAGA-associated factor 11 isoform X1 [Lolium perenne]|uniref:SAGA-associated factor 11 isoform X1 n=1 Tax=Lolium perenne TaxID=4522 RepID=UPI0021F59004|nr:SAGA-associated factor 11 isoform X1 [Lolium perenne]
MSCSNDAPVSPRSQLALSCFEELLDLAVADVASECHRIARLGLDRSVDAEEEELRAWAARAAADHPGAEDGGATRGTGGGGGNKGAPDVFGQTHPAIAADVVDCMNCGRPVVAGRFAPHLEKCMGKGRKARPKTTRSTTAGRNRSSNVVLQGRSTVTIHSRSPDSSAMLLPCFRCLNSI